VRQTIPHQKKAEAAICHVWMLLQREKALLVLLHATHGTQPLIETKIAAAWTKSLRIQPYTLLPANGQ
jgi:hypothetical protein